MTQLEFHDKFQTDEQMFVWANGVEEKIAKLESENTKLKEPKICLTCRLFEDNSCIHPEVEDFYVPQYIHHSGCGLHELEEG